MDGLAKPASFHGLKAMVLVRVLCKVLVILAKACSMISCSPPLLVGTVALQAYWSAFQPTRVAFHAFCSAFRSTSVACLQVVA